MIEDQIKELSDKVEELTEKVARLEHKEKWVSAKELAEIMGVSLNNVYIRIRSGEIYASRKLGSPRIPLSQFYNENEEEKAPESGSIQSLKKQIFT